MHALEDVPPDDITDDSQSEQAPIKRQQPSEQTLPAEQIDRLQKENQRLRRNLQTLKDLLPQLLIAVNKKEENKNLQEKFAYQRLKLQKQLDTVTNSQERIHLQAHLKQVEDLQQQIEAAAQRLEEYQRLLAEHEELQRRFLRLSQDYTNLQATLDKEVEIVHRGHQQEVTQYQQRLQDLMQERNHVQQEYFQLEQQYRELLDALQQHIEEEIHQRMAAMPPEPDVEPSAVALTLSTLPALPGPVETTGTNQALEPHQSRTMSGLLAQTVDETRLAEVIFLKRELQYVLTAQEQKNSQLEREIENWLKMQQKSQEDEKRRSQILQWRLKTRWQFAVVVITICALILQMVLQFFFLYSLGVSLSSAISFSLIAPVFICVFLGTLLATPAMMILNAYRSAPHKKKKVAT